MTNCKYYPVAVLLILIAGAIVCEKAAAADNVYLMTYFKEEGPRPETGFHPGDGLHLAWSEDGMNWKPLNGGEVIYRGRADAAFRDPNIIEGPDGAYHMVWTAKPRSIGYASSRDLVHWTDDILIPVMDHEPRARNSWAPELFYDDENGRFLIFWSSTVDGEFLRTQGFGDGTWNHRIYYKTTEDFKTYSETKLLYDPGFNCIDATIKKAGPGKYLMFLKNETLFPTKKNIVVAKSASAEGPYGKASPSISDNWVEGPSAVRIDGRWIVYFDEYTRHRYGAVASSDLRKWDYIGGELKVPEGARHGSVLVVPRDILKGFDG